MNEDKLIQCEQDRENEKTEDWYCEECKKQSEDCECERCDDCGNITFMRRCSNCK